MSEHYSDKKEWAKAVSEWCSRFSWLFDVENVKFFVHNLWNGVPTEWLSVLDGCSDEELQQLGTTTIMKEDWPLSFKEFIQRSQLLSVARKTSEKFSGPVPDEFMVLKMNQKKVHEVVRLSKFASIVCKYLGIETVVDIGAGEGYVSHFLAREEHLHVIATEGNAHFAETGNQRIQRVNKMLSQRDAKRKTDTSTECQSETCIKNEDELSPHFLTYILNRSNLNEFQNLISPLISGSDFALLGLHACGNLTLMLLDLFLNTKANALISVGCCYHVLIDDSGKMGMNGNFKNIFPVSKLCSSFNFELTWSSLKCATHASDLYRTCPLDNSMVSGNTLFYRAVVEVVLQKYFQGTVYKISKMNNHAYESFPIFLKQLPNKFKFKSETTPPHVTAMITDLIPEFEQSYKELESMSRRFRMWIALQNVIAPVLETMILLDRILYLEEHDGVEANFFPLFESSLSPRNMVIVASKERRLLQYLTTIFNSNA